MLKLLFSTVVPFLSCSCWAKSELQLVESWPVETSLDHSQIPDAGNQWLEMINQARKTIDFEQFYCSLDPELAPNSKLQTILDAVFEQADRGVKIRFLFDKKFYGVYPEVPDLLNKHPNIAVRLCDYGRNKGVLHLKMFVVDGNQAYLGSQNFDWRSLEHIQELGVRIMNPVAVAAFQDLFNFDWQFANGEDCSGITRNTENTFPVSIHYKNEAHRLWVAMSPKGCLPNESWWDLPMLIEAIDHSRQTVNIQLLSFSTINYDQTTFTELEEAIKKAAARGVKINMMLADWSKAPDQVVQLKKLQLVEGITLKLVSIPAWSKGFVSFARVIHCKYMTVDNNWSWLGTSNWSGDYFFHSRNAGIIVEGERFNKDLVRFFMDTWDSPYSETLDPDRQYQVPEYKGK